MASAAAPAESSFGDLLERLREAHELELQQLRKENELLRTQVTAVSERSVSSWRLNYQAASQPEPKALKDAFRTSISHDPRPQVAQPPKPTATTETARCPEDGSASSGSGDGTCEKAATQEPENNVAVERSRRRGSRNFVCEDMVPQTIKFQVICMERYPDKKWEELNSLQKVHLLRSALRPRYNVINPRCQFMKFWDLALGLALVFVGLVTPYEVVFLNTVHWSFFVVNRAVDTLFLADIVLNFFVAVEIKRPQRGGTVMLRDRGTIRKKYLKSGFFVDIISIFPFDVFSLLLSASSVVLQRMKILRCLKLLRLAKLLRILRTSKLLDRWRHSIAVQFATQKLVKFAGVLLLVSHWMACIWGLAGLTFGAELCNDHGQLVASSVVTSDVSWVTTLFLGGKTSPDNPCNHFEVYIASLHWAVMTLTSIGYGDIVPVRVEEYIIGILCMVVGGVLWAYIIGSVCSVITNASPVDRSFEESTDALNIVLREARVPQMERHKYREFLREAKAYEQRVNFNRVADTFSPLLRKHLMYHVSKDALASVYYFNDPTAPPTFLMDVASCLTPHFFSRSEPLDSMRHCLCLMDRGTVAHGGNILVPPNVFHEDFIITQKKYQKNTRTLSLTYTQLLVLTRDDMEQILEQHVKFARKIRQVAAKTAFCRAMRMTLVAYQKWKVMAPPGSELSLADAFDRADGGPGGDSGFALPAKLGQPSEKLMGGVVSHIFSSQGI